MTILAVRDLDPAWSPTSQQVQEPDTTFMLDPAGDAALGLAPAFSGLIPRVGGTAPSTVAGRYLQGLQSTTTSNNFDWIPFAGLLNGVEWPIEFQVKMNADWSTFSNVVLWSIGTANQFIFWEIAAGPKLFVKMGHLQNPASPSSYSVQAQQASNFSSGTFPGNTFIALATTLKNGVMTLWAEIAGSMTQVAQVSGVVAPLIWDATSRSDGLWLPATTGGVSNPAVVISDIRFGRLARTPGAKSIIARKRSTITVTSTPTGQTVQPLTGGLKKPSPGIPGSAADATGIAAQQATGAITSMRSGQWLQVTPILAGATPDAVHPSVGHSGLYCYDWQVVDRTLRYYDALGIQAYISLGGTPQILGGSTPPFQTAVVTTSASAQIPDSTGTLVLTASPANVNNTTYFDYGGNVYYFTGHSGATLTGVTRVSGTPGLSIPGSSSVNFGNLTHGRCFDKQSYNSGPPSSPTVATACADFGAMAGDLAYHILNEMSPALTHQPVGYTPWNEPDGGVNWETGASALTDFETLYNAIVTNIKAVSSTIKVGGPEISSWSSVKTSWVQPFIAYCATNSLALDFFSWHLYSGDLSEPYQVRLQLDAFCTANGLPTGLPCINGEWSWQIANIANSPWAQGGATPSNYLLNDWHAAYITASMIQQQANGVIDAHLCDPSAAAPNNMDVLFDQTTGLVQSNWNVFQLWAKMIGLPLVSCTGPQTSACDPGIFAQAAHDTVSGKYYALVAHIVYRKQGLGSSNTFPAIVRLPVAVGTAVTTYLIDDSHSNAYDAGSSNASLFSVTSVTVTDPTNPSGSLAVVQLRPRAVALLVAG